MRKLITNEWMTLDGVVQAPGYAEEGDDDERIPRDVCDEREMIRDRASCVLGG